MIPQYQRAEQKGGGETRTSHDNHRRNPARRPGCGDYLVLRGDWLSHARPSDQQAPANGVAAVRLPVMLR
jgi:hypothetical protein